MTPLEKYLAVSYKILHTYGWPNNSNTRYSPKEMTIIMHKTAFIRMFIVALFIIMPNWKQPDRMDKEMEIHSCNDILLNNKWDKLLISGMTQMNLKNMMNSQLISRFDHCQVQVVCPSVEHHPARNVQHETWQTTFETFNQSQHLLHTLHSCILAFLKITKSNMLKILCIFFHLQNYNGYTKIHQFW